MLTYIIKPIDKDKVTHPELLAKCSLGSIKIKSISANGKYYLYCYDEVTKKFRKIGFLNIYHNFKSESVFLENINIYINDDLDFINNKPEFIFELFGSLYKCINNFVAFDTYTGFEYFIDENFDLKNAFILSESLFSGLSNLIDFDQKFYNIDNEKFLVEMLSEYNISFKFIVLTNYVYFLHVQYLLSAKKLEDLTEIFLNLIDECEKINFKSELITYLINFLKQFENKISDKYIITYFFPFIYKLNIYHEETQHIILFTFKHLLKQSNYSLYMSSIQEMFQFLDEKKDLMLLPEINCLFLLMKTKNINYSVESYISLSNKNEKMYLLRSKYQNKYSNDFRNNYMILFYKEIFENWIGKHLNLILKLKLSFFAFKSNFMSNKNKKFFDAITIFFSIFILIPFFYLAYDYLLSTSLANKISITQSLKQLFNYSNITLLDFLIFNLFVFFILYIVNQLIKLLFHTRKLF